MGSSLSLSGCLPSSSSASSSGSSFPLAPPVTHIAPPVALPLASVVQLSLPTFLPIFYVSSPFPPASSFSPMFPSFPPPVASFSSSAPSLAPGFPFAHTVLPLAPPVGLHRPVSSLAPAAASLSFPVSALLSSSSVLSSSPLVPSYRSSVVASQLHAPVPLLFFSDRLFHLFGYCRLLVFANCRHLFVSFCRFLGCSCSFSGSPCGFSGLIHSCFFFSSSSCRFFPFCSSCSPLFNRLLTS